MGNVTSQQLELHRFLGLAVCLSTTADPRRLEHYHYTYWTAEMASLIICGHLKHCLLAPQFPLYVTPKDSSFDPDVSARTEADGDAEGVFVDVTLCTPRLIAAGPPEDKEEEHAEDEHVEPARYERHADEGRAEVACGERYPGEVVSGVVVRQSTRDTYRNTSTRKSFQ
ncbi:hypothetical protein C8J57DRAFT_1498974 [Mycena rebaudengoi]|nr:hypothetical protein C8J57DRAFT_1498974 [Mycena rebaudengoi]